MKKSPVAAMSNIREAVRRKSVGLSFTTNFSIFSRSASSTGEDSEHGTGEDSEDFNDDLDSSHYNRSREDSAPGEDDPDGSPSPAVSSAARTWSRRSRRCRLLVDCWRQRRRTCRARCRRLWKRSTRSPRPM